MALESDMSKHVHLVNKKIMERIKEMNSAQALLEEARKLQEDLNSESPSVVGGSQETSRGS